MLKSMSRFKLLTPFEFQLETRIIQFEYYTIPFHRVLVASTKRRGTKNRRKLVRGFWLIEEVLDKFIAWKWVAKDAWVWVESCRGS